MLIRINENKLRVLFSQMLKEAINSAPTFGSGARSINYKTYLDALNGISNLHTDRYKDYELEDAYKEWENTGFDKNSQEYLIYISKFKNFMFGSSGFLRNLSYISDRIGGPLHSFLLDPKWVSALNGKPNWRYSDLNSGMGGDDWQCFYTTVLKIYQNPAIWNDFFFNPIFEEYKNKFDSVVEKIDEQINNNLERFKTTYKPLLPKEYGQLKNFIRGVKVVEGKIEKVNNCHPELFYDAQHGSVNDYADEDDEEF